MSEENIENITKSNSPFAPTFVKHYILPDVNFNGHCLINNNISIPRKVISTCISYILEHWPRDLNTDFTIGNCLFGSIELTKNTGPDKYSGYRIEFDSRYEFSFRDRSVAKNVIIFGTDFSSVVHFDNENKDILILGEGTTQGLDDTTLATEAKYPINFKKSRKRFVLSLHYII